MCRGELSILNFVSDFRPVLNRCKVHFVNIEYECLSCCSEELCRDRSLNHACFEPTNWDKI